MRVRFVLLLALILALLTGTLSASAQVDRSAIETVLQQVKGIRGLQAQPGVPVDHLSQDQLRERMIQDFEEENPEEEIRTASEIMVMLGFIEPGLDLYRLYIDLYTEQIAGFYDPEEKRMFLISEDREMGAMDRYILAHELTHYLQDVNFDLQRPPFYDPPGSETETDDDASFAATCLVEGDAMLTSELWLHRHMDVSDLMEMQRESGEFSTEVLESAPEYVRDGLLFPYQEGLSFVRYLQRRGGFEAVNRAFREPPKSTEQIYHPEKYLAGEEPVPVEPDGLDGMLGEGWEVAYENVLGEFDVFELFKPYLGETTAEEAAAGWGGNVYRYYRKGVDKKLLVQIYAWDSEGDATEFVTAYSDYLRRRFGRDLEEEEAAGAWKVWSGGGYLHAIKKDGTLTHVLQGTDEEAFGYALAGLGEGGEELDEALIEVDGEAEEKVRDYGWLVIAGVAALFLLGLVLIAVMFVLLRGSSGGPAGPLTGGRGAGPYPVPPYGASVPAPGASGPSPGERPNQEPHGQESPGQGQPEPPPPSPPASVEPEPPPSGSPPIPGEPSA